MDSRLYDIVSFLGALQGILLSILFLIRKPRRLAALALGVYLLIFSAGLLEEYISANATTAPVQILYAFLVFSNFLYGPLLYLFVDFLTSKEPKLKTFHFLHALPFVIGFIVDVFALLQNGGLNPVLEIIFLEMLVIQILTYNGVAIHKLQQYARQTSPNYSAQDAKHIRWVRGWLVIITAVYIVSFSITHAIIFGGRDLNALYVVVQVLITFSIYVMSYRIMIDPAFFTFISRNDSVSRNAVDSETYQKSGLKPDQAAQYEQRLIAFLKNNKPYLNPSLSIYDLAVALGMSRNHLTEIINKRLGKNFYELINEYRIEEVKQLMCSPAYSYLSLSALGLEAGFKSKSAFNTNFKNVTGLTPSQWKQRQMEKSEDVPLNQVRT